MAGLLEPGPSSQIHPFPEHVVSAAAAAEEQPPAGSGLAGPTLEELGIDDPGRPRRARRKARKKAQVDSQLTHAALSSEQLGIELPPLPPVLRAATEHASAESQLAGTALEGTGTESQHRQQRIGRRLTKKQWPEDFWLTRTFLAYCRPLAKPFKRKEGYPHFLERSVELAICCKRPFPHTRSPGL